MASSTPDAPPSRDLRRIGEIVLAAAALDPHEREAYLRQVTVTQPALLAEARRRLRSPPRCRRASSPCLPPSCWRRPSGSTIQASR
jgi:hypothetical protein